jgi:CheY-like chemotaxis protein
MVGPFIRHGPDLPIRDQWYGAQPATVVDSGQWPDVPPRLNLMAKTVLIVDDNPMIRRSICDLFRQQADFAICAEAENGLEAIEKVQQGKPDLIVLDLAMPGMSGLDVARVINGMRPEVPIILFTLYSDSVVQEQARSAGISTVISKGERGRFLIDKARSLLNTSEAA